MWGEESPAVVELTKHVVAALDEMTEDERESFFLAVSGSYKTCCGIPAHPGWCACFRED